MLGAFPPANYAISLFDACPVVIVYWCPTTLLEAHWAGSREGYRGKCPLYPFLERRSVLLQLLKLE